MPKITKNIYEVYLRCARMLKMVFVFLKLKSQGVGFDQTCHQIKLNYVDLGLVKITYFSFKPKVLV